MQKDVMQETQKPAWHETLDAAFTHARQATLRSLFLIAALQPDLAWAEGHVEIVIRETTRPPENDKVRIDVTFLNMGDQPVFLHKPSTPFGRNDDALPGDQFVVTDATGRRMPYVGSGPGYWGPTRLSHFVKIMPGQSAHKEVDLSASYMLDRKGDYRVRFVARLSQQPDPDPDVSTPEEREAFVPVAQRDVTSNELLLHVSAERSDQETVMDRRTQSASDAL